MRVLAHINPGPAWRPGQPVWGQGSAVQAHLEYMRDRYDDGTLLVGGPLRSGLAGMALLEVANLDLAQDFGAADPAVAAEVLTYEVAELLPYFDALRGLHHRAMTPAAFR